MNSGTFLDHQVSFTQTISQAVWIVVQLQTAIEDLMLQAQGDVNNAAVKAVSAVAQAILGNTSTVSHLSQSAKEAKLESFDESKEKREQFVWAICIMVMMQIDTFVDKRMKILYVLLFMDGWMALV